VQDFDAGIDSREIHRPREGSSSLERLPNLSERLREASRGTRRAVFDAFELRIVYDKLQNRIEISATIAENLTKTFKTSLGRPSESLRRT
jgi:hypothetical protein